MRRCGRACRRRERRGNDLSDCDVAGDRDGTCAHRNRRTAHTHRDAHFDSHSLTYTTANRDADSADCDA